MVHNGESPKSGYIITGSIPMTLEISTCEQREMILSWEFIEHLNNYSEIFSSVFFLKGL